MGWDIVLFLFGIILVIKGGDWFVDASVFIAEYSRLPKVLIGATIVSLATAMPELLVSVFAVAEGETGLSLGNNIGSVICNTAPITGITLLFCTKIKAGNAFVRKGLFLLFCMAVLFISAADMLLDTGEGIMLLILFLCFIWLSIREARVAISGNKQYTSEGNSVSLPIVLLLFVVGALALVIGARLMVDHGVMLAEWLGIPSRIIGLTLVAIGTSLPEFVTAIKAITRKEYGLTVGNIVGANIVNVTLIPGLCAIVAQGEYGFNDHSNLLFLDIPMAFISLCIFILPAALTRGRLRRYQGVVMLMVYIAYLAVLIAQNQ